MLAGRFLDDRGSSFMVLSALGETKGKIKGKGRGRGRKKGGKERKGEGLWRSVCRQQLNKI